MDRAKTLIACIVVATALHGALAWLALTQRIFCGVVGPGVVRDDVRLYFQYASRAMAGEVPYRDFLIEYPILALPVFFLPRLVASDFAHYRVAFTVELLLFDALAMALVARRVARSEGMAEVPGRLAWYTLAFAALCPVIVSRYDLAPMVLAFAAALAWSSGRAGLGGTLTGLGTLMKIYPGVLAAPALAWDLVRVRSARGRGLLALGVTTAAGLAIWLAIGGPQVRDTFRFHAERGLEIGSLYAGASISAAEALGAPVTTDFNHLSTELVAPWSMQLARLSLPIQAAALLLVAWRAWRPGSADPMRLAAASVLAFIAFGKILSPQYMAWMLPFLAVLPGRDGRWARWVFLLAGLLTTMLWPWAVNRVLGFEGWAVGLLNYRNALLVGLWAFLTFAPGLPVATTASEIRAGRRPIFPRRRAAGASAASLRLDA